MTRRLLPGFTPRRFIGINGSMAAHSASPSQYSFAIDPLPPTGEPESDQSEPKQALIGFRALKICQSGPRGGGGAARESPLSPSADLTQRGLEYTDQPLVREVQLNVAAEVVGQPLLDQP